MVHLRPRQFSGAVLPMLLVVASHCALFADEERTTTVGMAQRIDQIVLPGSELEVKPLDDSRDPIVLRIAGTFAHGTDHRYDLVYYGLEPGTFDLKDYLRRKDGSPSDDLPSVPVTITAVLPPGQVEPNELESESPPFLGGYRALLILCGVVWFIGIFVILFAFRKKPADEQIVDGQPVSLADRLRPMVQNAMTGEIDDTEKAELERMLVTFWRRRLNLENLKAVDAIAQLRAHEEAGNLLRQLETWLHRPGNHDEVDLSELLKPYEVVEPTQA